MISQFCNQCLTYIPIGMIYYNTNTICQVSYKNLPKSTILPSQYDVEAVGMTTEYYDKRAF